MTRLGQMLYDDGKTVGKKEERTSIMTLIQKMAADGALAEIPRLATEPEFYQLMVEKYCE